MTLPDSTAGAQLASGYFARAKLVFLDFDGDPVRVTTAGVSLTFGSVGDEDLDGFTFDAVDPAFVSASEIKNSDTGGETVSFGLSGIVGPDSGLLAVLGDPSLWRGRPARMWNIIYDEALAQQGAVWPVFTGRMSAMQIAGNPGEQVVKLDAETYLAAIKQASGRTYLDQSRFDAADNTAALKIGAANGATKGVATAQGAGGFDWSPFSSWYVPF